jgi:glycosyltransferase involved in cell wall biosynthesis
MHVIAPAAVGGAEAVVCALASGRRALGGRTEVIALVDRLGPHPAVDELRRRGVPVHMLPCPHRRYAAHARSVSQLLASRAADLVHTHVYHANFVGYWAARASGKRIVATVHGFPGGDWKNRIYEWLDTRLLARFDAVMCVSDQARARVAGARHAPRPLITIPNGYGGGTYLSRDVARKALGLPAGVPAIGWVGRLSREKGPDLFVHALRHVKAEGAVAVMIGAGEEQPGLSMLATSLGFTEKSLRLVGARADAASLLSAFDVLVISSRTEGVPMVLIEAMAARTPVVAFAVGGIPHVLTERSGWLVPSGDTAACAAAITDAIGARDEAERRAAAARDVVRTRFGLEQWVRSVEGVYATVAA